MHCRTLYLDNSVDNSDGWMISLMSVIWYTRYN